MLVTSWRYIYRALQLIIFHITLLFCYLKAKDRFASTGEHLLIIAKPHRFARLGSWYALPALIRWEDIPSPFNQKAADQALYDFHR